jgi:hypothetical protein
MWVMLGVTVSDVWTLYTNGHGSLDVGDDSLVCLLDSGSWTLWLFKDGRLVWLLESTV